MERGRTISCLSNLKQLTIGLVSYTSDHEGNLPLSYFNGVWGPGLWNYTLTQPAIGSRWHGYGKLFESGYIEEPLVTYCPSQEDPPASGFARRELQMQTLHQLMRDVSSAPAVTLRTTYVLRATWDYQTQANLENMGLTDYPRAAVMSDMIRLSLPQSHEEGGNVTFIDGHGVFVHATAEGLLGYHSQTHNRTMPVSDDPSHFLFYADDNL